MDPLTENYDRLVADGVMTWERVKAESVEGDGLYELAVARLSSAVERSADKPKLGRPPGQRTAVNE